MKQLSRRNLVACLAAAAIVGLTSADRVQADSENSAVVINGYEAFVNLRTLDLYLLTTDCHYTLTKDGYFTAQCRFEIPEGEFVPDETLIFENLNCRFFGTDTNDCFALVTPSGAVFLFARLLPCSD